MTLKILHIDTEKGFRGGEQQVVNLMEGLQKPGGFEQAALVRKDQKFGEVLKEKGFQVFETDRSKPLPVVGVGDLQNLAKSFSPDIVHAHTGNSHTLAYRAYRKTYPIIVTRRVDFPIKQNFLSQNKYLHKCMHYIAISRAIKEILVAGGVNESKIDVIPSGIDPMRLMKDGEFPNSVDRKTWREKWNATDETFVFGMVGSYVDHKDPLNLIHAGSVLKNNHPDIDFRIALIGDGKLRETLEQKTKEFHLEENVFLTGWQDDVAAPMSGLDVFVMPSKLEGLCTSLIDAQAVGLPCVATRAGGIPDVITDGENGLLVDKKDPNELAQKMIQLAEDKDLQKKLAAKGRENVQAKFTIESMTEAYAELYRKIRS